MREEIKIALLKNLLEEVTKKYDLFIKEQENELKTNLEKAIKDPLTKTFNRAYFFELVPKYLEKIKRKKDKAVLIFLDLDNFKYINDNFGHKKGDEILKKVANILKDSFRDYDLVARFGGDEFIVFTEVENHNCDECVKELLKAFQERIEKKFIKYNLSVSYGISVFPDDTQSLAKLIEIADKRMYENKKRKKLISPDS